MGKITSLDKDYPIVTSNKFGKGVAIYIGVPAKDEVLHPVVADLAGVLSLRKGPDVPPGVMARQIDGDHVLYLNVSGEPKVIKGKGRTKSVLFDKTYEGDFTIPPYEPEFVEGR